MKELHLISCLLPMYFMVTSPSFESSMVLLASILYRLTPVNNSYVFMALFGTQLYYISFFRTLAITFSMYGFMEQNKCSPFINIKSIFPTDFLIFCVTIYLYMNVPMYTTIIVSSTLLIWAKLYKTEPETHIIEYLFFKTEVLLS